MMLLTQLERDGIIGQRRGVKAIDNHQLAIWLPDASKGREMRPLVKKRNKPSDFTLSKEMEEEQLAWQQAVLKKASTPKTIRGESEMSLDVYLSIPDYTGDTHSGSGIFIRENGQTIEITRDKWDERYPHREPVVFNREREDNRVYSANVTA